MRASPIACSHCAEACPAGVVTVSDRGVGIGEGCLGCGRCVAACPGGALSARGYAFPDELPIGNWELSIECWKVPSRLLAEGAYAVPCLGGLTASALLELVLAAGESRRVVLVDRGGCAACRAGGSDQPPVAAQLEFTRHALTRLGWPQQNLPEIRRDPLPAALLPDAIPVPAEREAIGRRAFFRFLAGKAADAVIERTAPPPRVLPRSLVKREEIHFPERIRLVAALENLAALRGVPLPAGLFPAVSISSEACANHGVCAGVCPTGALLAYEEEEATGIRFEPWMCAGCGLCARSCPEGALELVLPQESAAADARPLAHRVHLTRYPWHECPSCHDRFSSRQAGLCPRCEKNRNLAAGLFGTMFA